jgi:exodeoxyribonuclease VII large subunit
VIRTEDARAARALSVTELAREIQRQLRPLAAVLVKGEVSGLKANANGHYSFAIIDGTSKINAFLFAGDARRLPTLPEDGQEFIFRGRIDFWGKGGQIRMIVDWIEFDDVGRLRAQLEQLKHRLEAEGAFELARKRPIPFLPTRVALITSPTGAVIHDLQETIWDRFPEMSIAVYPALVQGTAAAGSIVTALRRCNRDGDSDVVVIARGGGSFEELYAFNTEPVARAILASRIPVATALGHTSDRTVADMVADAECRTPTEAGARVVPLKRDLLTILDDRRRRLDRGLAVRLEKEAERLGGRASRLGGVLPTLIGRRAERLERSRVELARLSPAQQIELRRQALAEKAMRVEASMQRLFRDRELELSRRRAGERLPELLGVRLRREAERLHQRRERLSALSHENVLARGYSITLDAETGHVLRSSSETAPGRPVTVRLARGKLGARVEVTE